MIDAARLFSVDGDGEEFGLPSGLTGIAFPYPDTEVHIRGRRMPLHRLRVDESCRRTADRKYETPSKAVIRDGLPYSVYVPPGVEELRKRTDTPVWLTEGEKKALVLTQHDRPCLGLPGVFMFTDPRQDRPHKQRGLHPDLARWRWRDRTAFVCFDADRLDNVNVATAMERLCTLLAAEGARVRVVLVPDGPGIDDHIVRHGVEALRVLEDRANPWLPEAWRLDRMAPDAPSATLWSQLEAMRTSTRRLPPNTLEELVERARLRLPALDPERVGRTLGLRRTLDVPEIVVNGRQSREVVAEAWDALLASELGEKLYVRGGQLVELRRDRPGEAELIPVSPDRLAAVLRRTATWVRDKGESGRLDTALPREVPSDMLAMPSTQVPRIDQVLRAPALGPDHTVWADDGFQGEQRVFLDLPPRMTNLLREPMDADEARRRLLDDLLGDFPFVAPRDRAHALAALLLPFVRTAIHGPTPLHLIEAPTEGTGKGLLADVIHRVATGRGAPPTTLPRSDDSILKKITAVLAATPAVVVLDNLVGTIDSANLASVLTGAAWADRRLGETRMLVLPNNVTWIATGNNPVLSRELARRSLRIRLDACSATPWRDRKFRHADLGAWVDAHRPVLVRAVLALVLHWLEQGRPPAPTTLGSYENWSRVVGGIIATAGVPGFLDRTAEVSEHLDPDEFAWHQLVVAWHEKHGTDRIRASELMQLASRLTLSIAGGEATVEANRSRFGKALRQRRDRVYGEFIVRSDFDAGRKQWVYWLAQVSTSDHP